MSRRSTTRLFYVCEWGVHQRDLSWYPCIASELPAASVATSMVGGVRVAQPLQDDCDVQATNIILHGLPPDMYSLLNHQEVMKGTELSYQERECRLYNLFDKFAYVQGEIFKFVTDVKLAKSLYTTNYDQLYAYLRQHERHANKVRIMHERYLDPLALVANSQILYNPSQSPQHSVSTTIHTSLCSTYSSSTPSHSREDLIDCINKAMAFLFVVASRFPPSNNQLRTSSNPRNQATIQDGRVTAQQVQERQTQSFASTRNQGIAKTSRGKYEAGQPKEKLMLAEAQEAGQILDEEQLAFIADHGIAEVQVAYCDSDVLSEVPYYDTYLNDMINHDVQENVVKVDNSREVVQDGRVKLVISKALIGSLKQEGHVEEGKHKRKLGFALESLTMKAQELHNGLPRWQSV
ncbi:hypothetical protein Tco_0484539 [Tanacetum coccineum]